MSADRQPTQRAGRRLLIGGLLMGVLVMAGVVTAGILVLANQWSDGRDPLVTSQLKYQQKYDICRRDGTGDAACTEAVGNACTGDPYFARDQNAVSDISSVCLQLAPPKS